MSLEHYRMVRHSVCLKNLLTCIHDLSCYTCACPSAAASRMCACNICAVGGKYGGSPRQRTYACMLALVSCVCGCTM